MGEPRDDVLDHNRVRSLMGEYAQNCAESPVRRKVSDRAFCHERIPGLDIFCLVLSVNGRVSVVFVRRSRLGGSLTHSLLHWRPKVAASGTRRRRF